MESLYSRIIWRELNRPDFKIHTAEPKDVDTMILDWVRTADIEKVEEVIFDMSWIRKTTLEDYYDGPFYGFSQQDDKYLLKQEGHACNLLLHDSAMVPTLLDMAIRTRMSPSELRLIADIMEIFYSRLPKKESVCRISGEMDHTTFGYKLEPQLNNSKEMKANVILAFLAFAEGKSDKLPSFDPVYQEIEALGLIKSEDSFGDVPGKTWHVTPEGEKFISLLESSGEYYIAQRQVKKDAEELIEKARTRWNGIMESLKF